MSFYATLLEVIELRSFSNVWYWILTAIAWSSASHYVIGVPWDAVVRARRGDPRAVEDLHDLVRVSVNRLLMIGRVAGLWMVAIAAMVLTVLAGAGFVYGAQFAQASFLLLAPLMLVLGLSVGAAQRIANEGASGEALYARLKRQRRIVQAIGMASIFVAAMWGMLQNLSAVL